MKTPLSTALRMGAKLTHRDSNPEVSYLYQSRPMLLALKGAGKLPMNLDDPFAFDMERHLNLGQVVAYPEEHVLRGLPSLKDPVLCPWCVESLKGGQIIEHAACEHEEEIDDEEECEWIAEMEAVPDMRTRALAVYFRSSYERLQVLEMARAQKMPSTHFLAAAARFVVKHRISLSDFVRAADEEAAPIHTRASIPLPR